MVSLARDHRGKCVAVTDAFVLISLGLRGLFEQGRGRASEEGEEEFFAEKKRRKRKQKEVNKGVRKK